jgi:hypothetical protein
MQSIGQHMTAHDRDTAAGDAVTPATAAAGHDQQQWSGSSEAPVLLTSLLPVLRSEPPGLSSKGKQLTDGLAVSGRQRSWRAAGVERSALQGSMPAPPLRMASASPEVRTLREPPLSHGAAPLWTSNQARNGRAHAEIAPLLNTSRPTTHLLAAALTKQSFAAQNAHAAKRPSARRRVSAAAYEQACNPQRSCATVQQAHQATCAARAQPPCRERAATQRPASKRSCRSTCCLQIALAMRLASCHPGSAARLGGRTCDAWSVEAGQWRRWRTAQ